jgi:hypothetical protein
MGVVGEGSTDGAALELADRAVSPGLLSPDALWPQALHFHLHVVPVVPR